MNKATDPESMMEELLTLKALNSLHIKITHHCDPENLVVSTKILHFIIFIGFSCEKRITANTIDFNRAVTQMRFIMTIKRKMT